MKKIKIAIMGSWNSDSGAALHSEEIGRELAKKHKLTIFSSFPYSFHGTIHTAKDESYVKRCFTLSNFKKPTLNEKPFLTSDYNIFVAEDLGMLPKTQLKKIFPKIKSKAKTINIIHDGKPSSDPEFWKFNWDAVVCFNKKYKAFLKKYYPSKKIHIIPYPCHPILKGNKKLARKYLGLPLNKKIVFLFGAGAKRALSTIPTIASLDFPLLILVVAKEPSTIKEFEKLKKLGMPIEIRQKALSLKQLYNYLHAADVLLYHQESAHHVVVPSTIFQCLGSGCPIVAFKSNFTETFNGEILTYSNLTQLKNALMEILKKREKYKNLIKKAMNYAKKNSTLSIVKNYIKLFNQILEKDKLNSKR
jgi:glycosyltransferase involved in cell wall biosynthesis